MDVRKLSLFWTEFKFPYSILGNLITLKDDIVVNE